MAQHVLIVDDEKEFTKFVAEALGMRAYQTTEANSGQEALDILAKTPIDLMTLDLNMPGMNGLQVAKIVNEKYPNVKIVVITGFGSDFDEQLKEYKIARVMPKPVPFRDLINVVGELLKS